MPAFPMQNPALLTAAHAAQNPLLRGIHMPSQALAVQAAAAAKAASVVSAMSKPARPAAIESGGRNGAPTPKARKEFTDKLRAALTESRPKITGSKRKKAGAATAAARAVGMERKSIRRGGTPVVAPMPMTLATMYQQQQQQHMANYGAPPVKKVKKRRRRVTLACSSCYKAKTRYECVRAVCSRVQFSVWWCFSVVRTRPK